MRVEVSLSVMRKMLQAGGALSPLTFIVTLGPVAERVSGNRLDPRSVQRCSGGTGGPFHKTNPVYIIGVLAGGVRLPIRALARREIVTIQGIGDRMNFGCQGFVVDGLLDQKTLSKPSGVGMNMRL